MDIVSIADISHNSDDIIAKEETIRVSAFTHRYFIRRPLIEATIAITNPGIQPQKQKKESIHIFWTNSPSYEITPNSSNKIKVKGVVDTTSDINAKIKMRVP